MRSKTVTTLMAAACLAGLSACATASAPPIAAAPQWEVIFDGETLTGWTPKMTNEALGADELGTFRVEDGVIRADYSNYTEFGDRFGLLFFERELTDYRLRFDYRFIGEQVPGGPAWALLNSGVMLHSQSPESVRLDATAPVSIEAQLLASHPGQPDRTTGNLCTPGTHADVGGTQAPRHCTTSTVIGKPVGEWSTFEVDVERGERMRFYVDGELSLELTAPTFDPTDRWAQGYDRAPGIISAGHIALQAESHGIEFRNIQLLDRAPVQ